MRRSPRDGSADGGWHCIPQWDGRDAGQQNAHHRRVRRRRVRVGEGGDVLQMIGVHRGCFACALGGADLKTLFMVVANGLPSTGNQAGTGQVLSIEVPVPGVGRGITLS